MPGKRPRPHPFSGKVVWITGASSGIGEALALAFAAAGSELVLSSRNEGALRDVASRCRGPIEPHVLPMDLADLEGLDEKAATVVRRHGQVDIMIHNAGVAHRDLAVDTPLSIDQRIMTVDHFGPVALTKALLPGMLKRGAGCFVVVGSMTSKYGAPKVSAYGAAKHALIGFFESLRTEIEPRGLQVTIVIPGFVRTAITENALTASGQPYGRMLPVHERGMSPETCAVRILRAVERQQPEALIGGLETLTVWLHRLFPRLLSRIIRSHPIRTRDRWLARLGLSPGRNDENGDR